MHEYAIATSLLRIACGHAGERPITRLHVKVGDLRQVVPSALHFSFELAAEGTAAEGAELELERVPAAGRCEECGAESVFADFPLRCEECGGFGIDVTAGEELTVEWLEYEDEAVPA